MEIRKARLSEAEDIRALVNRVAKDGLVLPRSLADVYEKIRDFFVLVGDGDELKGTAALHVVWQAWAEVRSMIVVEDLRGRGYGKKLVEACIGEARDLGIKKVFALTYMPEFFEKLGFKPEDKDKLPHKVWADCVTCPHFPDCGEVPVVLLV